MDGTFNIVAKPFTQLFSINVFMRKGNIKLRFINIFQYKFITGEVERQIPFMYVLMSNRTEISYTHILKSIVDLVPHKNIRYTVTDFEVPLLNSISVIMPTVNRQGCLFHFCQVSIK